MEKEMMENAMRQILNAFKRGEIKHAEADYNTDWDLKEEFDSVVTKPKFAVKFEVEGEEACLIVAKMEDAEIIDVLKEGWVSHDDLPVGDSGIALIYQDADSNGELRWAAWEVILVPVDEIMEF